MNREPISNNSSMQRKEQISEPQTASRSTRIGVVIFMPVGRPKHFSAILFTGFRDPLFIIPAPTMQKDEPNRTIFII